MSADWRESGRWLIGLELFEAVGLASHVFDLRAELPARVFGPHITKFVATDAAVAAGGVFSDVLNSLCGTFGDHWCAALLRRAHDDDLVAGFRFDVPVAPGLLWARLNYEPDGQVLRSYTSTAASWVFFGSSGQWGCWSDRDWELAIVGSVRPVAITSDEISFQSPWDELQHALSMSGGTLNDQDSETFFQNYA